MKAPETGEAVRLLQEALLSLGYSFPQSNVGGRLDGACGSETTRNVAQFQRAQGLMADGVAGKQTLEKLDAILPGQPASGPAEGTGAGAGAGWGQPVGGPGRQGGQSGGWGQRVGGGGAPGGGTAGGPPGGSAAGNVDPKLRNCLRLSSVIMCPHGEGRLVGAPIPNTDLISGLSTPSLSGCTYREWRNGPLTDLVQGPCSKAAWTALYIPVNGRPAVIGGAPAICHDAYGRVAGAAIIKSI